jgi:proteic killer suppression protein
MIKSFRCKESEKIFHRKFSKKLPQNIQRKAYMKLMMLDSAVFIDDLKVPPSNYLEKLTGDLKDFYSIRVNKQYRVCFKWENSDAYEVFIVDYH